MRLVFPHSCMLRVSSAACLWPSYFLDDFGKQVLLSMRDVHCIHDSSHGQGTQGGPVFHATDALTNMHAHIHARAHHIHANAVTPYMYGVHVPPSFHSRSGFSTKTAKAVEIDVNMVKVDPCIGRTCTCLYLITPRRMLYYNSHNTVYNVLFCLQHHLSMIP